MSFLLDAISLKWKYWTKIHFKRNSITFLCLNIRTVIIQLGLQHEQGKSEGFDSCDQPSNPSQIGFKTSIFQPVWPWNLMDDPKNNPAPLLYYFKLFASFLRHWWIQTGVTVQKRQIWVKYDDYSTVWPWNLTDDLKNYRAPLLCYFKLCASFGTHWWIQTGVTVLKNPIWVKINNFFLAVWPSNLTDDLEKQ